MVEVLVARHLADICECERGHGGHLFFEDGDMRVFIGGWCDDGEEPDWIGLDIKGLSWEQARGEMLRHLQMFADEDYCADAAREAIAELERAEPGTSSRPTSMATTT